MGWAGKGAFEAPLGWPREHRPGHRSPLPLVPFGCLPQQRFLPPSGRFLPFCSVAAPFLGTADGLDRSGMAEIGRGGSGQGVKALVGAQDERARGEKRRWQTTTAAVAETPKRPAVFAC